MARKTTATEGHEEIKSMLQKALDEIALIRQEQAKRAYLDDLTVKHEEAMNDNGKVGLKTIRNEWISQKTQKNAIVAALIIQIALNIIIK